MKKVYISVLGLITCICMILGLYLNCGFLRKNHKKDIAKDNWHVEDYEDGDEFAANLAEFDSIELDAKIMGVTVTTGNGYAISADYTRKRLKPIYEINNGVLTIKQEAPKVHRGNNRCEVEITVPRFTKLSKIDVDVDIGEVEVSGFDCTEIKINTDVGEVNLKDMDFDFADIETNVGEVDIKLQSSVNDYEIIAETDIGEIMVGGVSQRRKYSQKGNSSKRIKVETDIGEVNIK